MGGDWEVEGMILNKQEMMHINNDKFEYIVDNDVLTVSYSGIEDIFDFTNVSEGETTTTPIQKNTSNSNAVQQGDNHAHH